MAVRCLSTSLEIRMHQEIRERWIVHCDLHSLIMFVTTRGVFGGACPGEVCCLRGNNVARVCPEYFVILCLAWVIWGLDHQSGKRRGPTTWAVYLVAPSRSNNTVMTNHFFRRFPPCFFLSMSHLDDRQPRRKDASHRAETTSSPCELRPARNKLCPTTDCIPVFFTISHDPCAPFFLLSVCVDLRPEQTLPNGNKNCDWSWPSSSTSKDEARSTMQCQEREGVTRRAVVVSSEAVWWVPRAHRCWSGWRCNRPIE